MLSMEFNLNVGSLIGFGSGFNNHEKPTGIVKLFKVFLNISKSSATSVAGLSKLP